MMDFAKQKVERLKHADLSRKGSVDEALLDTVKLINSLPIYFTTSSCSGRIIIVENFEMRVQKNGCKWLYVSHDPIVVTGIEDALKDLKGEAVFKFEPMVMHVQCQAVEDAKRLHQAALAAGFRNSGITIGVKGKVIMAVRSTHSLEAPLSTDGRILVSQEYLQYLTLSANNKMEENFARIHRFHENVKLLVKDLSTLPPKDSENIRKQRKPGSIGSTETTEKADIPKENVIKDTSLLSCDDIFVSSLFDCS